VVGMHFFSPANVMKLLEIVRGKETRDDVLLTAMKLAKTIGKVSVVAGACHGFIGNRMLSPRQQQANALILEGANYWDVDDVLLEFGFPMGPFQMADLAGIDIGWHRDPSKVTTLREALCAAGRFGQKNGKGFYDYDEARNRAPSDEVKALIADFAARDGHAQREIGKDEIRERLLYPMVNEGAMILQEGMAQRASDIDVVWINGYGWPLWTGGPMFWASTIGLENVVAGLEKYGLPVSDFLRARAAARGGFE
ncbi:MAG: 3-hydroxyacyl-CoA dehydrogenase family protein, partial [Qipengyuania vulgaris]